MSFKLRGVLKRIAPREIAFLILPAVALGGIAFYFRQKPPSPKPQGWFIAGEIERLPVFPIHFARENGADCRVRVEFGLQSGENAPSLARGGDWCANFRLVETDATGRETLFGELPLDSRAKPQIQKMWRFAGISGGSNGGLRLWKFENFFCLNAWNRPDKTLELRVQGVWFPSPRSDLQDATLAQIAELERRPNPQVDRSNGTSRLRVWRSGRERLQRAL